MFIYCFDLKEKEELIKKGFEFMHETNLGNKMAYVFNGECKDLSFAENKSNYLINNKLFF